MCVRNLRRCRSARRALAHRAHNSPRVETSGEEHQFRRFFAAFGETYRVEIEELIEVGDSVLVFHRARARGRRSGAEVEGVNIAAIFTMRGGKIIRIDQPADREAALEAVGLKEQDARADSL